MGQPAELPRYLTSNDVARRAGVTRQHVHGWIKSGALAAAAETERGVALFEFGAVTRWLAVWQTRRRRPYRGIEGLDYNAAPFICPVPPPVVQPSP